MKFRRLQASISNNADQEPSLYMAFCAIESLFADLEDNCGTEISRCPVGDERLPSKLVWLCRVIREIYRDNDADLQRNRARLDAAVEKMEEANKALKEAAAVANRLAEQKARYAAVERQLQAAQDEAAECELLSEKCRQAEKKLAALRAFDSVSAKDALHEMTKQITLQEAAKADLLTQLKQAEECVSGLQQEVNHLQEKEQSMRQRYLALQDQEKLTREANLQIRASIAETQAQCAAFQEEGQQLIAQRDALVQQIEHIRQETEEFRDEKLVSLQVELEMLQEEKAQLEAHNGAFIQQYNLIKEQRNQLILDTAHKKAENESLSAKLTLTKEKLAALEDEKNCLTDGLSECLLEFETLQQEVERLNQQTLPQAQELCQQERLRKEELQQALEQVESESNELKEQIEALDARKPLLEEEIKNNQVVYDALTATCAASSTELENLERKIAELCNNTDEEKLANYRKQLEEKEQELESIQAETVQIQQQITQMGEQLEQMQEERTRLRDIQNRHEQALAVTEKQLRELEFAKTDKYLQEANEMEERTKLLESVRGKLAASVANMHKILGEDAVAVQAPLEEQMKNDLREIRQRMDDLRCALLECAQSIKMEER